MNFFGHAVVACWRSDTPAFVLGAMLPDFACMIRARPPVAGHTELAEGMAFHHATDHAFHDSPTFRALTAQANAALSAGGLRRGSARAAAHVGVEILLDAALAHDAGARRAYRAALVSATDPEVAAHIAWRDDSERVRFENLCTLLAERGVSDRHVAPELVTLRLSRTLADRPRLALDPASEQVVCSWASDARDVVVRAAPALLAELRRALVVE